MKELFGALLLCALVIYLWNPASPQAPTQPGTGQSQRPTTGSRVTRPVRGTTGLPPATNNGTLANRWAGAVPTPNNSAPGQTPASRWDTPSFQTNPFQIATPAPSGAPIGHWVTPIFQGNVFQTTPGTSVTPQWSPPTFQGNPFQTTRNSPSQSSSTEDPSLANRWKNGPK
ncbi:MAG TPA: hypothetical protein VGM62_11720 [Chthoniobacterales bacterium]